MEGFHRAGRERINVFPVGGEFLFRHYLDDAAFDELKRYYRRGDYRFEVPASAFDRVRAVLERHGYDPVVIEDPTPFTVVKRKYTAHPEVCFSAAVLHRSLDRFNAFVLADREAVERAVSEGATPIAETDQELEV